MTDRWIATEFLKSIESIDFRSAEPDHVLERRARLASMTIDETKPDTVESMALIALASTVVSLCLWTGDVEAAEDFVAARRAYAEAVGAIGPS